MGCFRVTLKTKQKRGDGAAKLILSGWSAVDKHRRDLRGWTRKRPEKHIVGLI